MGYVHQRTDASGTTRYTAIYRDINDRRTSAGTFATTEEARDAWRDAEIALQAGRVGDPRRGRQKFRHYVETTWFPHHVMQERTRGNYRSVLDLYLLPEFGDRQMVAILPGHVRAWVTRMQEVYEARPPTIRSAKVVLDAIFTTALNDQVTVLHAGRGVKTPTVAKKSKTIITAAQFQKIHDGVPDHEVLPQAVAQLLIETDVESGLRWGELTELRVRDLNPDTGELTISRVAVELKTKDRPSRFVVKDYPKDGEWRIVKLAGHMVEKLLRHIERFGLAKDDLLFELRPASQATRRRLPAELPDPTTLGLTEPNEKGRQYLHGTPTAYGAGRCRCRHCKDAVAAYRAARRKAGKDAPRQPRTVNTDGHVPGDWFRSNVWYRALKAAELEVHVTPHGLRHAHASWLLAGGADLQVVKERLGHGSITTTEKYLHSLPGAQDAALAALEAVRGTHPAGSATDTADSVASMNGNRDGELAELRGIVAKMSQMLAALSDSA